MELNRNFGMDGSDAGFSKGGGQGIQKILGLMKTGMKIFQPKTKFLFQPKLR